MARSFSLTVKTPDGAVFEETTLENGELVFGRSSSCDIMLTGENVSRRHARFYTTAEGLFVEDLGSINGVDVGANRIETDTRVGDLETVGIGDWHVFVREVASDRAGVTMLTLTWDDPDRSTTHYEIKNATTLVGRGRECGLVIPHPSVSRVHARLIVRADGVVLVEDAGSSNGVTVNGRKIKAWQLSTGDRIGLGDVYLVVGFPDGSSGLEPLVEQNELPGPEGGTRRITMWLPWMIAGGAVLAAVVLLVVREPVSDHHIGLIETVDDVAETVAKDSVIETKPILDVDLLVHLVEDQDFEAATVLVNDVVTADPTNIEAVRWSNRIDVEKRAAVRLKEGQKALESKDRVLGIQKLLSVDSNTNAGKQAASVLKSMLPLLEKESRKACLKGRKSVGCIQAKALAEKVSIAAASGDTPTGTLIPH